ncbi:MAG: MFS transporter [Paludibacteraceae bacterium]|nr:MFS transporter [Paludibacteraceae bacterium]
METNKIGYKDILKQKEYMKIITAALINRFGDSVDAIASAWIVYELTQKAYWSALIYALNLIPSVVITPLAGAFVEKKSKKKIMILTDLIRALCVAYIATAYLGGFLQGWHLIITTLVISTAEAFRGPSSSALTPLVLKQEYYEYGTSLSMSLSTIVEMVATGIAAGIIALIGTAGAIYVDMVTFVLSALIITTLHVTEVSKLETSFQMSQYLTTLREGFQYAIHLKALLFLCLIAMFLNAILVPFNSMQAPFVKEVLNGDASVLSVLGVTMSISSLLASISYPKISKKISSRILMVSCAAAIGLFYIGMIVAKPLYITKVGIYGVTASLFFVLGVVVGWVNSFASVQFMKIIDPQYLARCSALLTSLSMGVSPIASFFVSVMARVASISTIFIACGFLAIFVTILLLFSKTLKGMK